jgi:hypothetical protein
MKDTGQIDEEKATSMLHYAIDHGVNYVDTAYPYHNGESEPVVGRALAGGYREKVHLATKLPSWLITSREDMDKYLDDQLVRLRTDHIDFYLVHGLNRLFWENLSALGVTDFLSDALADGRIRYAGFSFHDSTKLFREIVKSYDWTFAQIQYNFMDEHYPWWPACQGSHGYIRDLEEGKGPAPARRMGTPMGLEPSGSDRRPLRYVNAGAGPAERRPCGKRDAGLADKDRALTVWEGQEGAGKADHDTLHRMQVLRALPARRQHPGVLRVLQPWAHVRRRRTDPGALFSVPRRFLRWHPSLCFALPGVRGMRGEMSPEPPYPREPERSSEIFREII